MNVFDLRDRLVADYASYTRSFIKIADPRISSKVDRALDAGAFWPEPLLQLNPTFLPGGTIDDLVADGTLHPECARDLPDRQVRHRSHRQAAAAPHPPAGGDPQGEGGQVLRPDQRHGFRQEPDLHRADRRPRAAQRLGPRHPGDRRLSDERPGQQPGRGTQKVPREGLSRRASRPFASPATRARKRATNARRSGAIRRTSCSPTT